MKVLIVEDDQAIRENLRQSLISDSHTVEMADNGADGSFLGRCYEYDAILLDYSMPKKDGLTVCKEIRGAGKMTPIIFMSVTGDTDTKVTALENGADDYITKPFAYTELSARIRAITRRPHAIASSNLKLEDIELISEKQIVTRGGEILSLTRKEYNLIEYFMRNPGIILSRSMLMEHVWTADNDPFSNTVESHIRNLRKKLNSGERPNLILNIPGRGYVFDTLEKLKQYEESCRLRK